MNRIKRYITSILILVIVAIFAAGMQQVYISAGMVNGKIPVVKQDNSEAVEQKTPTLEQINTISIDDTVQIQEQPKAEIDLNGVVISSEIIECIKKADSKNFDKNVKNYKQLLKELDVPNNYKMNIEKLMEKGYIISDIFTAYEFLYENYGLIDEVEGLLDIKKSGKTWAQVFKGYNKTNKEYVPSNFKPGYLEELFKDPNITTDDVINADRISQKGIMEFDELITLEKEGYSRKEMNSKIGIINTAEKLQRVAVTSIQVEEYEESIGLTEEQVVDAIVMAEKMGEDDDKILKMLKKGKKKEDILAQYYSEKYN